MTKPERSAAAPPPPTHRQADPAWANYVEDFRRAGHEAVDWIADYLANVGDRPVLAQTKPGELFDAAKIGAGDMANPLRTSCATLTPW